MLHTSILTNRKTKEMFTVSYSATTNTVTPLKKQSLFTQTCDYSPVEQFIKEFLGTLTHLTAIQKKNMRDVLRKEFAAKTNELNEIINHPTELATLLRECSKHTKSSDVEPSALEFLKVLSGLLVPTKFKLLGSALVALKGLFGEAVVLGSLVGVAGGTRPADYLYHQGQPLNGADLCAKSLYDCIQGYLAEPGGEWKPNLPQIARIAEQNATQVNACVDDNALEAMLDRAYRGPNQYNANCTLSAVLKNGESVQVTATNVDTITCNIMADSLVGDTMDCPLKPSSSSFSPTGVAIGFGVVGGVATLALLAFVLYRCCQHNHRHDFRSIG